jgi:hypothetical protein
VRGTDGERVPRAECYTEDEIGDAVRMRIVSVIPTRVCNYSPKGLVDFWGAEWDR